jgi:hypothetical protein
MMIFWTETNKFINGALSFITGGPFGASIASGLKFIILQQTMVKIKV